MALSVHGPIPADVPGLAEKVGERVEAQGYAIVEDVIDANACDELIEEVRHVERDHDIAFGQNDFEGFHTRRIFNLIARGPRFRELVIEPRVLDSVEAILGDGFRTSRRRPNHTHAVLHGRLRGRV